MYLVTAPPPLSVVAGNETLSEEVDAGVTVTREGGRGWVLGDSDPGVDAAALTEYP